MANANDLVTIALLLKNARQFIEQAGKSSKAVAGIGESAEKSGKKAGIGWKGMAKWAGGAAALYGAGRLIKGAVHDTEDLAKNTLALQRQTNLDTKTASEWVGVLNERGVSIKQFQVGLKTLSKAMEASRTGTLDESAKMRDLRKQYEAVSLIGGKKAPAALARLTKQMMSVRLAGLKSRKALADMGVSMDLIRKGDTHAVLLQVADALSRMKNPAERSTAAQKLFGRTGIALLPMLLRGRKGIEELLGVQQKYGNYLSGKNQKDTYKLIMQQRDMEAAWKGLKVQIGVALVPVLLQLMGVFTKLVNVVQPFIRQGWVMKTLLGVLVVAFIAYKIGVVAATIASWGLSAATWAWLGVILLAIVALAAIAYGLYYAYKRVGWFHNAVDAMWHALLRGAHDAWNAMKVLWNWIKQNWPLLLGILTGPIGLATEQIITHWKQIKSFVLGVIDAIKTAISNLWKWMQNLPSRVAKGVLSHIPGANAVGSALGHLGLQHGGTVSYRRKVIVGERGPELLSLPGGSTVTPLPLQPLAVGGAGQPLHITVVSQIDGREVARSVAKVTADKIARR